MEGSNHGSSLQPRNNFPLLPFVRNMRQQNHRLFCSSTIRSCTHAPRHSTESINLQPRRQECLERVRQRVELKCNNESGMALKLIYKKRPLCATWRAMI